MEILKQALSWVLVFLSPIVTVGAALLALTLLDLILGMLAAHKSGRRITSYGIGRTFSKLLAYLLGLLAALLAEQVLFPGLPIVKIIAGLISVKEFKSFLENFQIVTGIDVISYAVDKIQGKKVPAVEKDLEPLITRSKAKKDKTPPPGP